MKQHRNFWFFLGTLLLMILAVPAATSHAASGTFKVGMEAGYPPFNWTQNDASNGAVKIQGNSKPF